MPTHSVTIGSEQRDLPIINVGDVSVALLNLLGDTKLTEAAADELLKQMPENVNTFVTPEVKAVPLAHAMSVRTNIPYVVARKTEKPYMIDAVSKSVVSITTGKPQNLVIDGSNKPQIKGQRVAIVDDVVSTGETLRVLSELIDEMGGKVVATFAVLTEGDERDDVITLGHLPLYPEDAGK